MIPVDVSVGRGEPFEGDAGEIFRRRHPIEDHRLVTREGREKIHDRFIAGMDEKGVVPLIDDETPGDRLDLGEIHHHAIVRLPCGLDHLAGERDFQCVTMAVEMTALAGMVGNAVSGVEFEATGDFHEGRDNLRPGIIFQACVR